MSQRRAIDSQRYGYRHRQRRQQALARLRDGDPCARCGGPMYAGQELHLDHDDDGSGRYLGLSHKVCNLSAGGRKSHWTDRLRWSEHASPNPSRDW